MGTGVPAAIRAPAAFENGEGVAAARVTGKPHPGGHDTRAGVLVEYGRTEQIFEDHRYIHG